MQSPSMARKQSWPPANRPEENWVPGPALPSLTSRLVFHSFPRSAKGELKHMVHEFPYSSNCPRFSLLILSKQPERPLDTVQAGIQLGEGKETPGWSEQLWHRRLKNEMDKKDFSDMLLPPLLSWGNCGCAVHSSKNSQQWGKEKNDLALHISHILPF